MTIQKLKASGRRRVDSAALDAPHRLARYLVELSESGTDRSAAEIDIPLTQEEVATLIATSRESVVRALASLRSRGLVTTARRRITIRDLDGLRQYRGVVDTRRSSIVTTRSSSPGVARRPRIPWTPERVRSLVRKFVRFRWP